MKERIIKTIICSLISSVIWFGISKCFAVENIPQTVQDNYYATINWYNSETANNYSGRSYFNDNDIPYQLMTKNIANIILNDVDSKILNYMTSEEINEYKYYNLIFNGANNYIGLYISKNCLQDSDYDYKLKVSDLHYFRYNYDNDYNLSFDYHAYVPDTIYTINNYTYHSSGQLIKSIFLGTDNITGFTYNENYRYTGPFVKGITISSSTTYPKVDPTKDYDNNFLLNWNNLKGDQLTLDYDIYYYDEKNDYVSIKNLVYYLSSDISYGSIMAYYLSPENIKLLPNNTTFYLRTIFKTNYNFITSAYGPLIISDNTTVMFTTGNIGTGGDTGGGGGSEGGGDTGGSNVDLGNIENTLGDINTSIIETGNQINENLDEIEQAITDLNNTILKPLEEEEEREEFENIVNDLQSSLEETLENNSIFGALTIAEQGFFDIITGNPEDFKIQWNDVLFYDVVLIPAGEVNFSQMCRDIDILGTVKLTVNIILSAFLSWALIKHIYNLVLATLGIDNTYLYETEPTVSISSTKKAGTATQTTTYKVRK